MSENKQSVYQTEADIEYLSLPNWSVIFSGKSARDTIPEMRLWMVQQALSVHSNVYSKVEESETENKMSAEFTNEWKCWPSQFWLLPSPAVDDWGCPSGLADTICCPCSSGIFSYVCESCVCACSCVCVCVCNMHVFVCVWACACMCVCVHVYVLCACVEGCQCGCVDVL